MCLQDKDGEPLVEKIRDAAGQKGTGKWTAISALDKGMPVTLIGNIINRFIDAFIDYTFIRRVCFCKMPIFSER